MYVSRVPRIDRVGTGGSKLEYIGEARTAQLQDKKIGKMGQVPPTNQFASFYQINPATAAKGVNLLVDQGMLYKKRGLGMYVAPGARAKLLEKRRDQFFEQYVMTMLQEAAKLGITTEQVIEMVHRRVNVP